MFLVKIDHKLLSQADRLVRCCWNEFGWRKHLLMRGLAMLIVLHLAVNAALGNNSQSLVWASVATLIFVQAASEIARARFGRHVNAWLAGLRDHFLSTALRLILAIWPTFDIAHWLAGDSFHFVVHSAMFSLYFLLHYAFEPTGPRQRRDKKVQKAVLAPVH